MVAQSSSESYLSAKPTSGAHLQAHKPSSLADDDDYRLDERLLCSSGTYCLTTSSHPRLPTTSLVNTRSPLSTWPTCLLPVCISCLPRQVPFQSRRARSRTSRQASGCPACVVPHPRLQSRSLPFDTGLGVQATSPLLLEVRTSSNEQEGYVCSRRYKKSLSPTLGKIF